MIVFMINFVEHIHYNIILETDVPVIIQVKFLLL